MILLQHHQSEMELLSERAAEIQAKADSSNRAAVAADLAIVTQQWTGLLADLSSRKGTLHKLASHWEVSAHTKPKAQFILNEFFY